MNKYDIELHLHTLAICCTTQEDGEPNSFLLDDITFQHWDFTWTHGYKTGAWLVSGKIEANDFRSAGKIFMKKLNNIVPKIS